MDSEIQAAMSEETDPEILGRLASSTDPAVKWAVFNNPRTPLWAKRQLHFDSDLSEQEYKDRLNEIERKRAVDRDAFVDSAMGAIRQTLESGRIAYVHCMAYIRSQYFIDGQPAGTMPSAAPIGELGWQGWEVVGLFPHTVGIPMTNTIGGQQVLAGGLGGMVDGAYVLLRYPITADLLSSDEGQVLSQVEVVYQREHPPTTSQHSEVTSLHRKTRGQASSSAGAGGVVGGLIGYGFSISQPINQDSDEGDAGFDGGDFDF